MRLTQAELLVVVERGACAIATQPLGRPVAARSALSLAKGSATQPVVATAPVVAATPEPGHPRGLTGEAAHQAEIVWRLRQGTRTGRWRILVVLVRNDIRRRVVSERAVAGNPALEPVRRRQLKEAQTEGRKAKEQGLLVGFPDLSLYWPGDCGLLEVKTLAGRLSDEQRAVHDALRELGHKVAVVRSWPATLATLRAWGVPGAEGEGPSA